VICLGSIKQRQSILSVAQSIERVFDRVDPHHPDHWLRCPMRNHSHVYHLLGLLAKPRSGHEHSHSIGLLNSIILAVWTVPNGLIWFAFEIQRASVFYGPMSMAWAEYAYTTRNTTCQS
jgi:hypothetical protein